MKISSLPAVLTRLIVCMCVAYISYFDNCPPTLNFKQYVIVQNSLHFLPGYGVHQQFFEHREHPYRMQMDNKIGHRRIDFGMLLLHGCEPCLDHFRRTVGIILAEAFQRRTLCMEQQDSHQCAVLVNNETYSSMQDFRYFSDRIIIMSSPRMPWCSCSMASKAHKTGRTTSRNNSSLFVK